MDKQAQEWREMAAKELKSFCYPDGAQIFIGDVIVDIILMGRYIVIGYDLKNGRLMCIQPTRHVIVTGFANASIYWLYPMHVRRCLS